MQGCGGCAPFEAALAACHARARRAKDTDWPRIAELYDVLATVTPSAVVTAALPSKGGSHHHHHGITKTSTAMPRVADTLTDGNPIAFETTGAANPGNPTS